MYPEIASLFDGGHTTCLEKGEVLFRNAEPIRFMFLVEDGCVELMRHTRSGTRLALSRVRSGNVLAEASAYAEVYHCDGVSLDRSSVKRVSTNEFQQKLTADASLQYIWAKTLAHELQAVKIAPDLSDLTEMLTLQSIHNLVLGAREKSWAASECVGRLLERTQILAHESERLERFPGAGFLRVRQRSAFSSFSIPNEPPNSALWDLYDGVNPRQPVVVAGLPATSRSENQ